MAARLATAATTQQTTPHTGPNAWVSILVFVCSTAFFVWWQFIWKPGAEPARPTHRPIPKGPAMAIPKGRVRSGR